MAFEKLRRRKRPPASPTGAYQVVPYRPVRRAIMLTLLVLVVTGAAGFGFWLGMRTSDLDRDYLNALEVRESALQARLDRVVRELADVRLAQSVDAQAAHSLRQTIRELRDQVGGLREEVTFYKSLMAPSSIPRGLQIAELTLGHGDGDAYTFRVLLTQAAERRDWVQGGVELRVQGERTSGDGTVEEVLPLTELSEVEAYPLKFRFRYFQNLSGTVTLPDGFQPRSVRVTVTPKGGSGEPIERSFDWIVQAG